MADAAAAGRVGVAEAVRDNVLRAAGLVMHHSPGLRNTIHAMKEDCLLRANTTIDGPLATGKGAKKKTAGAQLEPMKRCLPVTPIEGSSITDKGRQ